MQVLDLFNTKYEQDLKEGAVDRLEQRRIDDLNAKMDDLLARAHQASTPEHKAALKREFDKIKSERDSYYKVKELDEKLKGLPGKTLGSARDVGKSVKKFRAQRGLDEGEMKRAMEADAERMSLEKFVAKYGDEEWIREFWNDINGPMAETGIGHDIADKKEKIARATPQSKAGAVASTVKHAARWLAGKGGPGKEGPTYESAQKKNSEEVEEESKHDLAAAVMLKKAHAAFPMAGDDAEALALWIADKEQRDVNRLERENEHEEEMIARIADQLKTKDVDEGWSDRIVAQRTGRPRTPYSIYISGKKWKDFENDDHAENVANKLRAKFEREGRDPSVITIAPTDYDKGVDEAANPAQQAAIAIAMKKAHKKPKQVDEAGTAGLEDTIRRLMAPAYEEETGGMFSYTLEKKAPTMARLRKEYSDDLNDIFYNATPEELHQAAQELKDMYGQVAESKETVFRSHDIEVEYPEGKGHSHIYHRREPYRLSTIFSDANSVAARNRRAKISLFVDGEYIPNYEWQEGVDAPNGGIAEDIGSWIVYDPETKQIKKRFKTHTAGKSYAKTHGLGFASSEYYFDNIKPAVTAEAQTDYSKRRRRERDVDAGRPVARQRPSKQTDYQKRRAEQKRQDELGEEKTRLDPKCWKGKKIGTPKTKMKGGVRVNNCVPAESVNEDNEARDAVESAIIRRILVAHKDLLQKFGPQKVMDAAAAIADDHSDVEEIGTSDVSAYVHQVERYLAMNY